ncbi:hypothetical protein O3G_MSEX012036 [Manduca sexta]|uniref:Esterase n=2 Tax=Manduca sexta TaxID=7130 RepID=A0A921ZMQ8_MANSE|nr:hypothetical protein O3G_MSEX012036 [Manduca sexta]UXP72011.1 esterase [Manduca sexta]
MIVILLFVCACVAGQENDILAVHNASGPIRTSPPVVFRGSWMTTRRGRQIEAYRGIRYAEPPVGELRFQPPKPILTYEGIVDAIVDGPACPQPSTEYPMSEDCLTVNVYTPDTDSATLRPVIVYIHGGGLHSLSGRSEHAGPHYLLDQDVVLVTMNYRLGILGFLALGTKLAPGNNGYKDQVTALRWMRRNIATFGGDPDRVTITGSGAGAASVMLHMISPMSKGLFHQAISMSGSPIDKKRSLSHPKELTDEQARMVGCPPNDTRLYDCLKTKPSEILGGTLKESLVSMEFDYDPGDLWSAVVESDFGQERFLTEEPIDAIRAGKMHAVPFIIGLTRNEFFWKAFTVMRNATLFNKMKQHMESMASTFMLSNMNASDTTTLVDRLNMMYFRKKELMNNTFFAEALGRFYTDSITGFSVHRMAVLMCLHSPQPVYYYLFDYIGNHSHYEDPVTKKPMGVAHYDELIYLFSLSSFPAITVSDSEDSKMVDKMTTMWYNFANTGKPNLVFMDQYAKQSPLSWPAMNMNNRTYLRIGKDFTLGEKLFENRFEVWEDLFRIEYRFPPVPVSPVNKGAWCELSMATFLNMLLIKALHTLTRHVGG